MIEDPLKTTTAMMSQLVLIILQVDYIQNNIENLHTDIHTYIHALMCDDDQLLSIYKFYAYKNITLLFL